MAGIIVISSGEDDDSAAPVFCSRHVHHRRPPAHHHVHDHPVVAAEPIVISSSEDDVELVNVIPSPCRPKIHQHQHTCNAKAGSSNPFHHHQHHVTPHTTPTKPHASDRRSPVLLHTCLHNRPKAQSPLPVAAVRPQPRSSTTNQVEDAHPPALQPQQSPSTTMVDDTHPPALRSQLSPFTANWVDNIHPPALQPQSRPPQSSDNTHLTAAPRPQSSSTSTILSPTKRKSRQSRNRQHARRLLQRDSSALSSTDSDVESQERPKRPVKRRRKEKENTYGDPVPEAGKMYLDKVVENTLTRMPVRADLLIAAGDLPTDNARDPAADASLKRNLTPRNTTQDSDSDVELDMYFKFLRSTTPGNSSRQESSSPEEVTLYHDLGRRALQENARVRNPRRISSPHRSPLHVTQDQARAPRSPAFQKRIHDRDSDLGFNPKRFKASGNTFRRLDLSEQSLKVHKPSKQRGTNSTAAVFSSDSSDCLPAIKWTPKKEKTRTDESRHPSAFNPPHRTPSAHETHQSAIDVLRKSSSRTEEGHRTVHDHRSAFQFLQSFSETSDSAVERTSKRTVSTPSKLGYIHRERVKSELSKSPVLPACATEKTAEQRVKSEQNRGSCAIESKQEDFSQLYLSGIPLHVKPPAMCNKCDVVEEESRLPFGNLLQALVEGCQEEGHHNTAVDFLQQFINVRRCPPQHILDYIIRDLLMKIDSDVLLVNAFACLKHMQCLHPPSSDTFLVEWKMLRTVVKDLLSTSGMHNSLLKMQGDMLVLKYITSMFGEDLETHSKDNTLSKSYAYNMLSADSCFSNVRNVIQWMCICVERIIEEEDSQLVDNAPFLPQDTSTSTSTTNSSGHSQRNPSQTRLSVLSSVLQSLQKLLHMCLVVSGNLGQSSEKVADELFYYYQRLPKYCHKKKVLQTITCHPMRVKLLELILSNCYIVGDNVLDQSSLSLSVSKIVEFYFKHIPSDEDCFSDAADDNAATTKDIDCEELAMLLLHLMQSYLWSSNAYVPEIDRSLRIRLLTSNHNRHQPNQLMPFHGRLNISMTDKEYLITMGDYVEGLQARLERHCPKLTNLTLMYLGQLDAMRDLVDWS